MVATFMGLFVSVILAATTHDIRLDGQLSREIDEGTRRVLLLRDDLYGKFIAGDVLVVNGEEFDVYNAIKIGSETMVFFMRRKTECFR